MVIKQIENNFENSLKQTQQLQKTLRRILTASVLLISPLQLNSHIYPSQEPQPFPSPPNMSIDLMR